MIKQLAGTLNLSAAARMETAPRPASPAARPAPAQQQAGADAGTQADAGLALPAVSALAVAANENDAESDAARLAARALAREKARAQRQRRQRTERRRWLALLVFVLLVAVALQVFAAQVVRLLPGMAQVYAALSVPVQVPGWRLREWQARWGTGADGAPELLLRGRLLNDSGRTLPMPLIHMELLNADGVVLYRWRIPVRHDHVMKAGGEARFRSRLAQVPEQAASVRLRVMQPAAGKVAATHGSIALRPSGR